MFWRAVCLTKDLSFQKTYRLLKLFFDMISRTIQILLSNVYVYGPTFPSTGKLKNSIKYVSFAWVHVSPLCT